MPDQAEREKHLAAEMIFDAEGLTDDLEDAAAKRLLNWGAAQAKRLALEAADGDLERAASNLRRVIKRVNNLVTDRAALPDDEFAAELTQLVALASRAVGLQVTGQQMDSQPLLANRNGLDDVALVDVITALLTPSASQGDILADRAEAYDFKDNDKSNEGESAP